MEAGRERGREEGRKGGREGGKDGRRYEGMEGGYVELEKWMEGGRE